MGNRHISGVAKKAEGCARNWRQQSRPVLSREDAGNQTVPALCDMPITPALVA